jgi:pimeloyl-ACP methyl ester carboxylesterase
VTYRFGHGPELLIALHGFGEDGRRFAVLEEALQDRYTVVAFDLPFHGGTEWPRDAFSKADILHIINGILEKEGHTRFSILAFSFGARLALAMLPDIADKLDKLILLAPEGIGTHGMFAAEHTPMVLRKALQQWLRRPGWLLRLLYAGYQSGLISALAYKFITYNLAQPERYRRVFGCWLSLNDFSVHAASTKQLLLQSGIPLDIYIGARDDRVRLQPLQRFVKGLPKARLFVVDDGHQLLNVRLKKYLADNK